jgi:uncharacterized protein YxeA
MSKKILISLLIILILITILFGSIYFYTNQSSEINNQFQSEPKNYEECINQINNEEYCKKYIFTPENEIEEKFLEIINKAIKEQAPQNITIYVEEIKVSNFTEKIEGSITLNCEEISYEEDKKIIESITEKLITNYPDDFAKDSKRYSKVLITGCSVMGAQPDPEMIVYSKTDWIIYKGFYSTLE